MAYQNKPGFGNLFKNRFKKEGDRQPDWKGEATAPDGTILEISLWKKTGEKGPFYGVGLQLPRQRRQQAQRSNDDDIW